MPSAVEIFTAIWKTLTPDWQDRIPADSMTDWDSIRTIMSADTYAARENRNQIYNALVNRIALTRVIQQSLTNPITAAFKKGSFRFGDTVQEIMADVIKGHTFEVGRPDPFAKEPHRVESAYHLINRKMFYKVTIEETMIERAFDSAQKFMSLTSSIINQMYNADRLDEMQYMTRTIVEFANQTEVPLAPAQILKVPDPRLNLLDRSLMQSFLLAVKGRMNFMRFPNTELNPFGFTRQTENSDFVLLLDSQLTLANEVINLSSLFHSASNEFNMPIIPFPNFGQDAPEFTEVIPSTIIGVITDRNTFEVFDTLRTTRQIENPEGLYFNHFYHVHQLYMASPFYNCTYLVTDPEIVAS